MTQTMNGEQTYAEKQPTDVESTQPGRCYVPAVDIVERPDEMILTADVPGATAEAIDVRYEDGELRIHAPVKSRQGSEQRYLLAEYGVGDYHRVFRIGETIDAARIAAEFVDGVLTLRLPKVEAVKPRRISVKAS